MTSSSRTLEVLVRINRAAQGLDSHTHFFKWLSSLPHGERDHATKSLVIAVQQSRPTGHDVVAAVSANNMNPAHSCWIMLMRSLAVDQIERVATLSGVDSERGITALILLLGVADSRRRQESDLCRTGKCHHWWHGDLEDSRLIERLRGMS